MAYEHVGKVAWVIHGGGTNGSYYDEGEIDVSKVGEGLDFIRVCDILEEINAHITFPIKTLKIHRWTSPGASLITNSYIDEKFRYLFAHMNPLQAYDSAAFKTRSSLGAKVAHPSVSVGDVVRKVRGPGELLKDLQVFTCDSNKYNDIITNEHLESEYKGGRKDTDPDFGIWITMPNVENMENEYYIDNFVQNTHIHDEVFKMGKKSEGTEKGDKSGLNLETRPPSIRMGDIVAKVIIMKFIEWDAERRKAGSDQWGKNNPWPLNWEIYPTTCSPISDVRGRQALVKYEKKTAKKSGSSSSKSRVAVTRLDKNPGLWFMYLLNIITRIKIFKDGKQNNINRKPPLRTQPKNGKPYNWNPGDMPTFENVFDCLDPDERKDIYTSFNGILQNIRPNDKRIEIGDDGFHNVLTLRQDGNTDGKYNLFKDDHYDALIEQLAKGVRFDNRSAVCVVGEERGLLDEILSDVDGSLVGAAATEKSILGQKDDGSMGTQYKTMPKLVKLIFYLTYNLTHVDPGIDQTGKSNPLIFGGIAKKYEVLPKGANPETGKMHPKEDIDWSMTSISQFQRYEGELDVGQDSEKMARGIKKQHVSVFTRGPLHSNPTFQAVEGLRTYDEWQMNSEKLGTIANYIALGDGVLDNSTITTLKEKILCIMRNKEKISVIPGDGEKSLYEQVIDDISFDSTRLPKIYKIALEQLINGGEGKQAKIEIVKETGPNQEFEWGQAAYQLWGMVTRKETLPTITEYYVLIMEGGRKKRTRRKRRKRRKRKKRTRKKRRRKRKRTKKKRKRTRRR